jgi:hypothetical protein
MVRSGNVAATQVLIKWRGLDEVQATWEDYALLKLRFPEAALWEADLAQGEGSVTSLHSDDIEMDIEFPVQAEPGLVKGNEGPLSENTCEPSVVDQ